MSLYEVTNGFTGNGYVRVYAWAENEAQALEMAAAKFKAKEKGSWARYGEKYWTNLTAQHLFSADSAPFCTDESDEGWEMPA